MTDFFVGIDSGTQSTKTIIINGDTGKVVASAVQTYDLIDGLPTGHKEQVCHVVRSFAYCSFTAALVSLVRIQMFGSTL